MIEGTLDDPYLIKRLLREALRELLTHELTAVERVDKRINHIGDNVEYPQRKERDDVEHCPDNSIYNLLSLT